MFDDTTPPANLPLEKGKAPPPRTPQKGPAPANPVPPAPAEPGTSKPPKSKSSAGNEPEDIFAGIDTQDSEAGSAPSEDMSGDMPRKRGGVGKALGIVVLVLLVLGGAGVGTWYFLIRDTGEELPAPQVVEPEQTTIVVEEPPSLPPETTTAPPALQEPPQAIQQEEPVEEESPLIPESEAVLAVDTDEDGLTDPEETIFGTHAVIADSDGDSFPDGSEVQNGYDPSIAVSRLDASSRFTVAELGDQWRTRLPVGWSVVPDEIQFGDLVIETASDNLIMVRPSQKPISLSLNDWLAVNRPDIAGAQVANPQIEAFTSWNGYEGIRTTDGKHMVLTTGTRVMLLELTSGGSGSIDYPNVFNVIVQMLEEVK